MQGWAKYFTDQNSHAVEITKSPITYQLCTINPSNFVTEKVYYTLTQEFFLDHVTCV